MYLAQQGPVRWVRDGMSSGDDPFVARAFEELSEGVEGDDVGGVPLHQPIDLLIGPCRVVR